jgi:hypothetical protein
VVGARRRHAEHGCPTPDSWKRILGRCLSGRRVARFVAAMQSREAAAETWRRLCVGTTIPALQFLREVPRAATPRAVVQAVAREHARKLRRAS